MGDRTVEAIRCDITSYRVMENPGDLLPTLPILQPWHVEYVFTLADGNTLTVNLPMADDGEECTLTVTTTEPEEGIIVTDH